MGYVAQGKFMGGFTIDRRVAFLLVANVNSRIFCDIFFRLVVLVFVSSPRKFLNFLGVFLSILRAFCGFSYLNGFCSVYDHVKFFLCQHAGEKSEP